MMMQRAALIIGIIGAVIVLAMLVAAIVAVRVMVMDMSGGAIGAEIVGHIFLAGDDMLKMSTEQRHDSGDLGDEEQRQQPWTHATYFAR
jgi:hypothetical protein